MGASRGIWVPKRGRGTGEVGFWMVLVGKGGGSDGEVGVGDVGSVRGLGSLVLDVGPGGELDLQTRITRWGRF